MPIDPNVQLNKAIYIQESPPRSSSTSHKHPLQALTIARVRIRARCPRRADRAARVRVAGTLAELCNNRGER